MTDDSNTSDWHRAHRRTTLKIAGVTCASLAGFAGTGAAHSDKGKGQNKDKNKGGGKGKWCCGCPVGDQQGTGYERNTPHEDDETRWDDWQPGDGKPPWAGDDDEEEEEEEDEDSDEDGDDPEEPEDPPEPGVPDNPGEGDDEDDQDDGDGDQDSDDDDDGDSDEPDEDDDTAEEPDEDDGGDDTSDEPDGGEDGTEDGTDGDGSDSPEDGDDDTSEDEDSDDDSDDSTEEEDDSDDPTASLAAQIETRVHEETNAYREEQDEDSLDHSEDLAAVARAHSEDMAEQDYFEHESPDGSGPGDRLNEADVDCNGWGENIAWEQSSRVTEGDADSIADSVVEGWINSPGHRQNLLGNYSEEGIGVAVLEDQVYVTQVFCNLST